MSMRKTGFLTLTTAAICLVLAACGGGGGGDSSSSVPPATTMGAAAPAKQGDSIAIKDFAYAPAQLTVAKGTSLTFTNQDSTPHTATSGDAGGFDTGAIQPEQTKSVTLDRPGTFDYICSFHPFMHGTVTVEP
jgi:plastocyanin